MTQTICDICGRPTETSGLRFYLPAPRELGRKAGKRGEQLVLEVSIQAPIVMGSNPNLDLCRTCQVNLLKRALQADELRKAKAKL